MPVIKRCEESGCTKAPRCAHPWTLVCQYEGKRHRMELLEFAAPRMAQGDKAPETKADAEAWEPQFRIWVMAGCPPIVNASGSAVAAEKVNVQAGCDLYAEKYLPQLACKLSPSVVTYIGDEYGDRPILSLYARDTLQEFKDDVSEDRSKSTANGYLRRLRHMLNWWRLQYGIKGDSPFYHQTHNRLGVKFFSGIQNRDRRMADEEEDVIRKMCEVMPNGYMMRGRMDAALDGCMRRGEMLKVDGADVLWGQQKNNKGLYIALRAGNTKGAAERMIPVKTERLYKFLEERKGKRFVFGNEDGSRADDFREDWSRLLELAGLERWTYEKRAWGLAPIKTLDADLHWHDLRHEGASRLAEGRYGPAMPVPMIQRLLGHKDIKTTMIYLNMKDHGMADAMGAAQAGL